MAGGPHAPRAAPDQAGQRILAAMLTAVDTVPAADRGKTLSAAGVQASAILASTPGAPHVPSCLSLLLGKDITQSDVDGRTEYHGERRGSGPAIQLNVESFVWSTLPFVLHAIGPRRTAFADLWGHWLIHLIIWLWLVCQLLAQIIFWLRPDVVIIQSASLHWLFDHDVVQLQTEQPHLVILGDEPPKKKPKKGSITIVLPPWRELATKGFTLIVGALYRRTIAGVPVLAVHILDPGLTKYQPIFASAALDVIVGQSLLVRLLQTVIGAARSLHLAALPLTRMQARLLAALGEAPSPSPTSALSARVLAKLAMLIEELSRELGLHKELERAKRALAEQQRAILSLRNSAAEARKKLLLTAVQGVEQARIRSASAKAAVQKRRHRWKVPADAAEARRWAEQTCFAFVQLPPAERESFPVLKIDGELIGPDDERWSTWVLEHALGKDVSISARNQRTTWRGPSLRRNVLDDETNARVMLAEERGVLVQPGDPARGGGQLSLGEAVERLATGRGRSDPFGATSKVQGHVCERCSHAGLLIVSLRESLPSGRFLLMSPFSADTQVALRPRLPGLRIL